jgi:hypothetical protein
MSEPKKRRKPPAVKVKGPDGKWRELETGPPPSDDPEIVELWEMPVGELQKILDDPEHPLREKALVVTNHAFAPLQEALQELSRTHSEILESIVKPIESIGKPMESIGKPIESLLTTADQSWISEILPAYPVWQELRRSRPQPEKPFIVDSIDFDSVTPPDAPLREVASAVGDAAVALLQELVTLQREYARADASSSGEALAVARESLKVARGGRTASWWAAGAAIFAGLVGIATILVTIAPK